MLCNVQKVSFVNSVPFKVLPIHLSVYFGHGILYRASFSKLCYYDAGKVTMPLIMHVNETIKIIYQQQPLVILAEEKISSLEIINCSASDRDDTNRDDTCAITRDPVFPFYSPRYIEFFSRSRAQGDVFVSVAIQMGN